MYALGKLCPRLSHIGRQRPALAPGAKKRSYRLVCVYKVASQRNPRLRLN